MFLYFAGVGGNLVAVQASRISTSLHKEGKPGEVSKGFRFKGCISTFFGKGKFEFEMTVEV